MYKKKEELPPLNTAVSQIVEIHFAEDSQPQSAATNYVKAGIDKNYNLRGISYIITTDTADDALEKLRKKYGNYTSLIPYEWQNGLGGSRRYYVAVWSFPL